MGLLFKAIGIGILASLAGCVLMGRVPKGYNTMWGHVRMVILVVLFGVQVYQIALASFIGCGLVAVNFLIGMGYVNTKGTLHSHMNKALVQHVVLGGIVSLAMFLLRYMNPDSNDQLTWIKILLPIAIFALTTVVLYAIISSKPTDEIIKRNATIAKKKAKLETEKAKAEMEMEEADVARTKAQAKLTKSAVRSVGGGAVVGAAVAGAHSGAKIGANAATTENLLMQADHISRVNDKLANTNLTEEQAKYIQEQTMKGHEIGAAVSDTLASESANFAKDAIKVGFDVVRKKAASMGMSVDGKSDEEVAQDIIDVASAQQIESLPEGLDNKEKAAILIGADKNA